MRNYRRRRSIAGAILRGYAEDRPGAPGSRVIASLLAASGRTRPSGQSGRKAAEYEDGAGRCQFALGEHRSLAQRSRTTVAPPPCAVRMAAAF